MYVLDKNSDTAIATMGKRVSISETEDGTVTIWHNGTVLAARAFEKEGHVQQAAIVNNKLLGRALEFAKQAQVARDEKKLASSSLSQREKRLLRARQSRAAG